MWRTLIVSSGEKLTVNSGWLHVCSPEREVRVPINDLYSVVIDNRRAMLSVAVLTTLAQAGVHILFCDEKHLPASHLMPLNDHYQPLTVVQKQLELGEELKDRLWQRITQQKILNQAQVLRLTGVGGEKAAHLESLAQQVQPGDSTHKEAQAARFYFRALFGPGFVRGGDDVTNAALNYGYTILRSALCKTLAGYGYNCLLGLHHINRANPFNLADDLMEPFRPLVDLWVDDHCEDLFEELTRSNRNSLIDLVNHTLRFEGKRMRVRYVMDRTVKSLTSAIDGEDAGLLLLPTILRHDPLFEDEQDG